MWNQTRPPGGFYATLKTKVYKSWKKDSEAYIAVKHKKTGFAWKFPFIEAPFVDEIVQGKKEISWSTLYEDRVDDIDEKFQLGKTDKPLLNSKIFKRRGNEIQIKTYDDTLFGNQLLTRLDTVAEEIYAVFGVPRSIWVAFKIPPNSRETGLKHTFCKP
jgi:hypothetical protein